MIHVYVNTLKNSSISFPIVYIDYTFTYTIHKNVLLPDFQQNISLCNLEFNLSDCGVKTAAELYIWVTPVQHATVSMKPT